MKHGWEMKKLGEIIKLEYGKPLPSEKRNPKGKFPVYGANGEKDRTDEYYHYKQSIIIGRKGSAGEINFSENKFWPLDVTYFVIYNEKEYDLKFLYYLLSTLNLPKLAKGVKPGINRNDVYAIDVKIPPLPEQKHIVAILNEAFTSIAKAKENAEKNLENAKELFESYLNGVFAIPGDGWEKRKIVEVIENTETINPTQNPNNEFIYIDVSSINNKNFIIENTSLLKGKNAPSRARKLIKANDVIFATVRPTLRRIAIISQKYNEQVCSTGYFVLRAKEQINNKLLFYFLLTNSFNEKMEKLQKGASYPAVTDRDIKEQIIFYPKSISEQKSIIAKLDGLSAETKQLENIYRQKIIDLEELKKAILSKAFNGEL